ncbi:MAG: hypothetical protein AAFO04_03465 [Cyanobacteria bacterium J06592_8]
MQSQIKRRFLLGAILTPITGLLIALPVEAVTFVSSRAELDGNDLVDWSSNGQVFNPSAPEPSAFLPNQFSATSENGLELTVNIPVSSNPQITPPFIFKTAFPPDGIPTNFADGNFLLFSGFVPIPTGPFVPAIGNPGPIEIQFETPVKAAGTQLGVDDTFEFTAFLSAFDENDSLLATFSVPGTSSLELDNSAIFLGVSSEIANISKLVFRSSEPERAIAINQLSLMSATTQVPEPTLIGSLMSLGILSFGLALQRK